jgi:hypothetical protein
LSECLKNDFVCIFEKGKHKGNTVSFTDLDRCKEGD